MAHKIWQSGVMVIRAIGFALMILLGILVAYCLQLAKGKDWHFSRGGLKIRQRWMRTLCLVLNVDVERYGRASSKPSLIVANHVSWIDVLVIGSSTPCAFVAKRNVLAWPLIGKLAQMAGTVFVDRENRRNAVDSMRSITQFLAKGCSVAVFPEGTTSAGATVQTFHRLLFEAPVRGKYNTQAAAVYYPGNMQASSHVPFVGEQSFGAHLVGLLSAGKTRSEIYFCGRIGNSAQLTRKALAETTQNQIQHVLQHCEAQESRQADNTLMSFQTRPLM